MSAVCVASLSIRENGLAVLCLTSFIKLSAGHDPPHTTISKCSMLVSRKFRNSRLSEQSQTQKATDYVTSLHEAPRIGKSGETEIRLEPGKLGERIRRGLVMGVHSLRSEDCLFCSYKVEIVFSIS